MTRKEAAQVLAILKAAYPYSYNGMTKDEAVGVVSVWAFQFAKTNAEIVLMAVNKLIGVSKFPPTVADVKEKIRDIYCEARDTLLFDKLHGFLDPAETEKLKRICELTERYHTPMGGELPLNDLLGENTGENILKLEN